MHHDRREGRRPGHRGGRRASNGGLSIHDPEAIYRRFADIFNSRDYDALDTVMVADFLDHHPGLVDVTELSTYKRNLAAVINATEMKAHIDDIVAAGDKVFTRITLTGRHVGDFLGVPASGNPLEWVTHELWRAKDGRMVERWAVDDLLTLLHQMGVKLPLWSDPPPTG